MFIGETLTLSLSEAEDRIREALEAHGVPGVVNNQPIGRYVLRALLWYNAPAPETPHIVARMQLTDPFLLED